MLNRLIAALTTLPISSANRQDGYFGWTDRYGIRAQFDGADSDSRTPRRSYITQNG